MYAPIISFVAVPVVGIVSSLWLAGDVAKLLTYIAPNHGVHGKGVHKQHKGAYEKPGAQEHGSDVHTVVFPW